MAAYLLLLVAVLSRFIPPLMPHAGLMNFTAVTGGLLYFGARRPWREMLVPLAALMASDYLLTTFVYRYPFHWQGYIPSWIWYIAGAALGWILLKSKTTFWRVGAGVLLGPTAFWLISNYASWPGNPRYPQTLTGLWECYVAGIPFYRNDLVSTAIVAGLAFGVPVLVRRMHAAQAVEQVAK